MKPYCPLLIVSSLLSIPVSGLAGASTGSPFYGDAPDDHHPWAVHDHNRPQPKLVTAGSFSTQEQPGQPPSDAIILFDGTDLSKWEAAEGDHVPTKWIVKNGAMECVPGSGYIRTKEQIGDCQLHVEWAAPINVQGDSQGRGNSGVFLMGLVEIQVLDNYNNPTYADGFAGSVYGQNPPMANALRAPGQYQTYDIVFRRPIYKEGKEISPGYVTVFENGVCVQDHTIIEGPTGHMARTKAVAFPEKGALQLQDHGNPVRYRNIWYRPLPMRTVEGSTDGYLTSEATMAKRAEIASALREKAEKLKDKDNPVPELLAVAESLVYERDDSALERVKQLSEQYLNDLQQMPADKLAAKKDEIKHLRDVARYLARWEIIPDDAPGKLQLEQIVKEHNWDKK